MLLLKNSGTYKIVDICIYFISIQNKIYYKSIISPVAGQKNRYLWIWFYWKLYI